MYRHIFQAFVITDNIPTCIRFIMWRTKTFVESSVANSLVCVCVCVILPFVSKKILMCLFRRKQRFEDFISCESCVMFIKVDLFLKSVVK